MSRIAPICVGAGVALAAPGEAAIISLCRTADGAARIESGRLPHPGCVSRPIAADAADIEWTAALPRLPRDDEEIVVVIGAAGARRIEMRSVAATPAPLPALAVGMPLLGRFTARPFGVEERVVATAAGDSLTVRCARGTRPAGVLLDPGPVRLPRQASYRAIIAHRGDHRFRIAAIRAGTDAGRGRPLDGRQGRTPVETVGLDGPVQFVLLCPNDAAEVELRDLSLEPARASIASAASAWAWQPTQWRAAPGRLVDAAVARGVGRLHVSVEIDAAGIRHADALARFVRLARAHGLAVDAVEGDPGMIRPAGRADALARARALAHYQRNAAADARLDGIQYDIEPYVLPEFSTDRTAVLDAWCRTIAALATAVGGKLDVVVPFWIADRDDGESALDRIAGHLRGLTVMAYRTDPAQAVSAAEPLLAWGTRRGLPVRIALEMGRLDDETEVRYRAGQGTLGLLPVGGSAALVKLRDGQRHREAMPLAAVGSVRIAARRLSFQGDASAMLAAADQLRPGLSAWPSFVGFTYHGLF